MKNFGENHIAGVLPEPVSPLICNTDLKISFLEANTFFGVDHLWSTIRSFHVDSVVIASEKNSSRKHLLVIVRITLIFD